MTSMLRRPPTTLQLTLEDLIIYDRQRPQRLAVARAAALERSSELVGHSAREIGTSLAHERHGSSRIPPGHGHNPRYQSQAATEGALLEEEYNMEGDTEPEPSNMSAVDEETEEQMSAPVAPLQPSQAPESPTISFSGSDSHDAAFTAQQRDFRRARYEGRDQLPEAQTLARTGDMAGITTAEDSDSSMPDQDTPSGPSAASRAAVAARREKRRGLLPQGSSNDVESRAPPPRFENYRPGNVPGHRGQRGLPARRELSAHERIVGIDPGPGTTLSNSRTGIDSSRARAMR